MMDRLKLELHSCIRNVALMQTRTSLYFYLIITMHIVSSYICTHFHFLTVLDNKHLHYSTSTLHLLTLHPFLSSTLLPNNLTHSHTHLNYLYFSLPFI